MNWGTVHETSRPLDILEVQYGFEATTANELTVKEGDFLFILFAGTRNGWVRGRPFTSVYEDPSTEPSGWVPRSCLTKLQAEYRGCALYEYSAASENCIAMMHLGQRMDIYARLGNWLLVKLDGSDGKVGGTGYVPSEYVEIFDEDDTEIPQPPALKALPREYCYLCESSIRHANYFECKRCRLPNGDPFYICRHCAYHRKALFMHQVARGEDHLFSRGTSSDDRWNCENCRQSTNGSASLLCLTCSGTASDVFELCYHCYHNSEGAGHDHHLIPISDEGTLLENQVTSTVTMPPLHAACICNGCRRDTSRYVLVCDTCPNSRFKLCAECAELDRATFLHDRWAGGGPHGFDAIDRRTKYETRSGD